MFKSGDKVVMIGKVGDNPNIVTPATGDVLTKGNIYCVESYLFKERYGWIWDGVILVGKNSGHCLQCYDAREFRKIHDVDTKIEKYEEITK